MNNLVVGQTLQLALVPTADGVTADPAGETGTPTIAMDTAGILSFTVDATGFVFTFTALAAGVVNITPSGVNTLGNSFSGAAVAVTVAAPAPTPATSFIENVTIGVAPVISKKK